MSETQVEVLSFYRFSNLGGDLEPLRTDMRRRLEDLNVKGRFVHSADCTCPGHLTRFRIYLASEGINGQVHVPERHVGAFKAVMDSYEHLTDLELNVAIEKKVAFQKLIVAIKRKGRVSSLVADCA